MCRASFSRKASTAGLGDRARASAACRCSTSSSAAPRALRGDMPSPHQFIYFQAGGLMPLCCLSCRLIARFGERLEALGQAACDAGAGFATTSRRAKENRVFGFSTPARSSPCRRRLRVGGQGQEGGRRRAHLISGKRAARRDRTSPMSQTLRHGEADAGRAAGHRDQRGVDLQRDVLAQADPRRAVAPDLESTPAPPLYR